jgi:hypothetical protein
MDPSSLLQSPFAPLTFVVAPALLTNASSVLAMSTVNRMVRAHDRMHGFFAVRTSVTLSDEPERNYQSTVSIQVVDEATENSTCLLNGRYGCRTPQSGIHPARYLKRGSGHQFLSGIAKSSDCPMAADGRAGITLSVEEPTS